MAESSTITPTDGAYSAVFLLAQESLKAGAPGLTADIQNAIARSVALKLVGRKLAPAAYGDKRQPYHSGACIGICGLSVNLRFSDNSAELVFHDEDLELINEEGRDLYIARLPASEILALRQSLIDYLPAGEAEISAGHGVTPPVSVTVPGPDTEERLFWLEAAEQHGFSRADDGVHTATDSDVLKLMAAARKQGRKDVLDALAMGGARG